MQLVRETMKKEAKLIKLQEIEGMLKRVLDYLRNIQKNKPRQDLKELPVVQKSKQVETWLTSQAGPSSIETSTSNKEKWSDEDTDKIVNVFTQTFGSLKKNYHQEAKWNNYPNRSWRKYRREKSFNAIQLSETSCAVKQQKKKETTQGMVAWAPVIRLGHQTLFQATMGRKTEI